MVISYLLCNQNNFVKFQGVKTEDSWGNLVTVTRMSQQTTMAISRINRSQNLKGHPLNLQEN